MKISSEKNTRTKALDKKFWTTFKAKNWEKKALSLQNVESPLRQIDEKQIFKMVVAYADICRRSNSSQGFKLYLHGELQHSMNTLEFLPEQSDQSLLGYHERMQNHFPDYCLVCDELLQVSQQCLELLTDFTNELYKHIGFPNRFSEIGLYLGNYKKTPFGVHVDGCGVFSFPAVGTKKFRIWSPDYVKKNPELIEAHEYEEHKKHSLLLTAKPGDMTYWPSQDWHIAESDGSFSATWSLGVWVDRSHQAVITETMTELLQTKLGSLMENNSVELNVINDADGAVTELPKLYQKTIKAVQAVKASEIEDAFLQTWLKLASRKGFKNFPVTKSKKQLQSRDVLKIRIPASILYAKMSDKKTYCFAFDANLFFQKPSKKQLQLIQKLNLGTSCKLNEFVTNKKALKLIQQLFEAGALFVVS